MLNEFGIEEPDVPGIEQPPLPVQKKETSRFTFQGKPAINEEVIDADTLKLNGTSRRMDFSADELGRIKGGVFVPGQATDDPKKLFDFLHSSGFTDMRDLGRDPTYTSRRLSTLVNPKTGETSKTFLTKLGMMQPTSFDDEKVFSEMLTQQAYQGYGVPTDPALKAAYDENKRREDLSVSTRTKLVVPTQRAINETALASFRNAISNKATNVAVDRKAVVEEYLSRPNLPESERVLLEKERDDLTEVIFRAGTTPKILSGSTIRREDRNEYNQARNPMTETWYTGWDELAKGVAGIKQQVGKGTGWASLEKDNADFISALKLDDADKANVLSSFRDVNTSSATSTISGVGQVILNNTVGMVPMVGTMATSGMLATLAGAPLLLATGVSVLAPTLLYSGQYYADQPLDKKNALLANTMGFFSAVADRLSLGILMKPGNVLSSAGRRELLAAIEKKQGVNFNLKEANTLLDNAIKSELVALANVPKDFAKRELLSPEAIAKQGAVILGKGASEAGTETLQQYMQMAAESGEWNRNFEYRQGFKESLEDAASIGGAIGSTLGIPKAIKDAAQWHSITSDKAMFNRGMEEAQVYQALNEDRLAANKGGYTSTLDAVSQIRSVTPKTVDIPLKELPQKSGFFHFLEEANPVRMFRQLALTAIPSIVNEFDGLINEKMSIVKAIMGGYGILPGEHAAGYAQRISGKIDIGSKAEMSATLKVSPTEVEGILQNAYSKYWSKGIAVPPTEPNFEELGKIREKMESSRQVIIDLLRGLGMSSAAFDDENSLFQSRKLDPTVVVTNKQLIIDEAQAADPNANQADIADAVNNLLSKDSGLAASSKSFLSKLGVFSNPKLEHIFELGVLDSLNHLKEQASRSIAAATFLGKDGTILSRLLREARDPAPGRPFGEFKSEEDYKHVVTQVNKWFEIFNGTYKRSFYDNHPKIDNAIAMGTTMTMLAYLPKAAISSQPEASLGLLGTPGDLAAKQIKNYALHYKNEFRSDLSRFKSYSMGLLHVSSLRHVPSSIIQKKLDSISEKLSKVSSTEELDKLNNELKELDSALGIQEIFSRLGFRDTGYDAISKFEYSRSTNLRKAMEVFASGISLRAQSDANRLAILSVAGDALATQLTVLSTVPKASRLSSFGTGRGLSREQYDALRGLQSVGLDVTSVLNNMDNGTQASSLFSADFLVREKQPNAIGTDLQENILAALGNYIDSRTANPQAHNTPAIFNNPHFRLITTMTKFMATASAILIPRLYRDFILKGGATMRYQAFSVIAGTLLVGYLTTMLKDELSYGEESPYVKGKAKKAQRIVSASGLLGQYDRILNTLSPIIEMNKPDILEKPFSRLAAEVKDLSPVAAWGARIPSGVSKIAEGKTEAGVYDLLRATPVIAAFPIAARNVASMFKETR